MTAKKIQNSVDWPTDTYKEPQMSADSLSSSNSYTAAAERSVFHGTLYSLHAQCSSAICTWSSHNCWVYILLADFSFSNERASDTEEYIIIQRKRLCHKRIWMHLFFPWTFYYCRFCFTSVSLTFHFFAFSTKSQTKFNKTSIKIQPIKLWK